MKKLMCWAPRAWAILFLLLFSIYAIASKNAELGFYRQAAVIFMLAISLGVAWKWKLAGGCLFIISGIAYFLLNLGLPLGAGTHAVMIGIPVLTGFLFILDAMAPLFEQN